MKRVFLTGLSALSLSALMATSALAESKMMPQNAAAVSTFNAATTAQVTPNHLVNLAYQGNFRNQGIPSYGALLNAHAAGQVTAQTLIQAAINAGKLPATTLSDSGYAQVVATQLASLSNN